MINNKNKKDVSEEEMINEINQILKNIDIEWKDILEEEEHKDK